MSTGPVGFNDVPNKFPAQANDPLSDVDLSAFLDLMIAELQNQDPLNPMENSEMLAQLGQIRSIAASDKMRETLDSVLFNQNVSAAASLIGKKIEGLVTFPDNSSQRIRGEVSGVTVADGVTQVRVGSYLVRLDNIAEVLPSTAPTTGG